MDTPTKKSENKNTSAGDDDADSRSSSESRGTLSALCSPNTPTPPSSPVVGKPHSSRLVKQRCGLGPRSKFKLIEDGDIQLCRLNHTRTIISKIMNSKYLRRWEMHHLIFGPNEVSSTTPQGFMETPIAYSNIQDVNIISRWDAGQHFCIRITLSDGSLLLQAPNSYMRDEWMYSVQWKRHVLRYERLLKNTRRPEVLVKEIKNMIDLSLSTPIQDDSIYQFPLDLVSQILQENVDVISQSAHEQIIIALGPLLENNHPTQEICNFFSKHCKNSPRSNIVIELFTPVVQRILKHNMDFGKYPQMRTFTFEYLLALSSQNNGLVVVQNFIKSMHGSGSTCPHPRILPNLVAVCLAAIHNCYEIRRMSSPNRCENNEYYELESRLVTCLSVLETMSEFDDWRLHLAPLLQSIPFPDEKLKPTICNIGNDLRCDVHLTVLGIREGKEGWFDLYCPGGLACDDSSVLYGIMLKRLIGCCCRRKRFLVNNFKMISPWQLLALRENETAMDVLCAVLEYDLSDSADLKMQIITTLQSTSQGKSLYSKLCERQIQLRELQQKGGPRKLTLPSKSTDADLAKMLSSGSFGNLECLSLAFTQVTSSCAKDLIKLPSLRYLNLWSTQFGDAGLQEVSEHLHKLQVLNLCETPVTDKGLCCLSSLKNLRKLNLNSTHLSALTFEGLKEKLPALQECDVRYTDAW